MVSDLQEWRAPGSQRIKRTVASVLFPEMDVPDNGMDSSVVVYPAESAFQSNLLAEDPTDLGQNPWPLKL